MLRSIERSIALAEEEAEKLAARLAEFLRDARFIVFTYTGRGVLAAYTAYWVLRTLRPEARVELHDPEALSLHVAAYNEPFKCVVFGDKERISSIVRIADSASLSGHEVMVLAPAIADEAAKHRLSKVEVERVDSELYGLSEAMAAAKAAVRSSTGSRAERLQDEVVKFVDAFEGAYQALSSPLEGIVKSNSWVLASPTLMGAALYAREVLAERGLRLCVAPLHYVPPGAGEVVVMHTGVEDYAANEACFNAIKRGVRVRRVRVNTDPLTAPVYVAMVVAALVSEDREQQA